MPNDDAAAPAAARLACRPLPGKCDCVLGGRRVARLVERSGSGGEGPRVPGAFLDVFFISSFPCSCLFAAPGNGFIQPGLPDEGRSVPLRSSRSVPGVALHLPNFTDLLSLHLQCLLTRRPSPGSFSRGSPAHQGLMAIGPDHPLLFWEAGDA